MNAPLSKLDVRLLNRDETALIDPQEWDRLADSSITPNPFYERWCLIPALAYTEREVDVRVVTVYYRHRLVALFPIAVRRKFGLFRYLSIWRYPDCLLCDVLREGGVDMAPVLLELMQRLRVPVTLSVTHTAFGFGVTDNNQVCRIRRHRPAITHARSWEDYQHARPRKQRKEDDRVVARLLVKEGVRYRTSDQQLADQWLPVYFDIEDDSWRSIDRHTLRADSGRRRFFEQAVRDGERLGKVEFQGLFNETTALAMAFRFKTQSNAYEIKTAYRDNYRGLYPGVVLELLNMRELLQSEFRLVDSCARRNRAVERIWPDRITLYRSVLFNRSFIGDVTKRLYRIYLRLRESDRLDSAAFR